MKKVFPLLLLLALLFPALAQARVNDRVAAAGVMQARDLVARDIYRSGVSQNLEQNTLEEAACLASFISGMKSGSMNGEDVLNRSIVLTSIFSTDFVSSATRSGWRQISRHVRYLESRSKKIRARSLSGKRLVRTLRSHAGLMATYRRAPALDFCRLPELGGNYSKEEADSAIAAVINDSYLSWLDQLDRSPYQSQLRSAGGILRRIGVSQDRAVKYTVSPVLSYMDLEFFQEIAFD